MAIQNSNYELLSDTRNYILFLHKYIYDEEILTILADFLAEDESVIDYDIYSDGEYNISLEFGCGKISDDAIFESIKNFFSSEEIQQKIETSLSDLEHRVEISKNNINILRKVNEDVLNGDWYTLIVLYDKFDYITKITISL